MDPTQIPLRGLHLPDAIGWWPIAPGWWVVIALLIIALALLLRRAARRHKESAARRYAVRALERSTKAFAEHGDPVLLGKEVSEILRRTMLAYAPREDVAAQYPEVMTRMRRLNRAIYETARYMRYHNKPENTVASEQD